MDLSGGVSFKNFVGGTNVGLVGAVNDIIVPAIFALAFAVFIWGVLNYFFIHGENETEREKGKHFIVWGILGMVVLLSVWGFVNLLLSTLSIAPSA